MTYNPWPTANQQQQEQGRTDVVGIYILDPATGLPFDSSTPTPTTITNANRNGQSTSVNSAPVVLASDQLVKEISGLGSGVTGVNTDLLPWTDVGLYKWVDIHITGTYNATLTFQESGDGVNVGASALLTSLGVPDFGSTSLVSSTSSTGLILSGPLNSRWFRIRATAFTSNASLAATVHFYMLPPTIFPTILKIAAGPSGGSSTDYHLVSAATTNAAVIKSSAGQVYGYEIYNANAAVRYVKLYNKSTTPAPATDPPYRTIAVPPATARNFTSSVGIQFSTGIGIATVTGIADTDNTGVSANDLVIDIDVR